MSAKFNGGAGGVICDGCGTLLLTGKLPGGGGYRTVVRPVVVGIPDGNPVIDFCSGTCAAGYVIREIAIVVADAWEES